jgi:hypothetical protein
LLINDTSIKVISKHAYIFTEKGRRRKERRQEEREVGGRGKGTSRTTEAKQPPNVLCELSPFFQIPFLW